MLVTLFLVLSNTSSASKVSPKKCKCLSIYVYNLDFNLRKKHQYLKAPLLWHHTFWDVKHLLLLLWCIMELSFSPFENPRKSRMRILQKSYLMLRILLLELTNWCLSSTFSASLCTLWYILSDFLTKWSKHTWIRMSFEEITRLIK